MGSGFVMFRGDAVSPQGASVRIVYNNVASVSQCAFQLDGGRRKRLGMFEGWFVNVEMDGRDIILLLSASAPVIHAAKLTINRVLVSYSPASISTASAPSQQILKIMCKMLRQARPFCDRPA